MNRSARTARALVGALLLALTAVSCSGADNRAEGRGNSSEAPAVVVETRDGWVVQTLGEVTLVSSAEPAKVDGMIPESGTIAETRSGCLGLEGSQFHRDALLVFPEGAELLDDGSIRYEGEIMRVGDRIELSFGGVTENPALQEICEGHSNVVIATGIVVD